MANYAPKHRKDDGEGATQDTYRPLSAKSAHRSTSARAAERRRSSRQTALVDSLQSADSAKPAEPAEPSKSPEPLESSERADASGGPRFRLSLALGIVFIVIALVIAVFLAYKYLNAGRQHEEVLGVSGIDMAVAGDTVASDADLDDLDINWDALRAINPDIVGWLMIPDTRINYPIVQASDNDYYLKHLFDKSVSEAGAIFLDSENDSSITGQNNIIYGHNLLDGSMFAGLKSYQAQDYFDAHRKVLLATPAMNYRLEVDAALVCDADDRIRRFGFADQADYEEYVKMLLGYAVINELEDGEIPESIYCLVTCTSIDYSQRTMVMASVVESRVPPKGASQETGDVV